MSEGNSTSAMAQLLLDGAHDPELIELLRAVAKANPLQAQALVQDAIVRNFSTATLTRDYGASRPGGLEMFKFDLNEMLRKKDSNG